MAEFTRGEILAKVAAGEGLEGADLSGANLMNADVSGSEYSADTKWPEGFDPKAASAELEGERDQRLLAEQDSDLKDVANLSQAIELDPGDTKAYFKRGMAYQVLGEDEKAVADFRRVIAINDDTYLTSLAQDFIKQIVSGTDTGE